MEKSNARKEFIEAILAELDKREHHYIRDYPISHHENDIIVDALIDGNIALFSENPYSPALSDDYIATVRGNDDHHREMYIGNFMDRPETYSDMSPAEQKNIVKSACDMIEKVQKQFFPF